jgi:hypothetical protein
MTETPTNLEARREAIRAVLRSAGSTIFSVKFIKKDGTERVMQIQLPGIVNRLAGGDGSESHQRGAATRRVTNPNLMAVLSVDSITETDAGIRQINLDTVVEVNLRGFKSQWSLPTQIAA